MPLVDYSITLPYRTVPNIGAQPAAEVELYYADGATRAVGIIDSGAVFTIFSSEYADLLGIDDVRTGRREGISTLAGEGEVFMFDLELRLTALGGRFAAQVGFFPTRVPRNILGRNVLFAQFQIGFRETRQELYFRSDI